MMHRAWFYFVIVWCVTFGILEGYGFFKYGSPGTLSASVRYWTSLHPIIPYFLGLLVMWLAFHFWASKA